MLLFCSPPLHNLIFNIYVSACSYIYLCCTFIGMFAIIIIIIIIIDYQKGGLHNSTMSTFTRSETLYTAMHFSIGSLIQMFLFFSRSC